MKTFILAATFAAIVTQSEGCDVIKRLTGKEWPEVPVGTRRFLIIAGVWGAMILFLIARYLITAPNDRTK